MGLASGLTGMEAFLLRLTGDGVELMLVTGDEAVIRGTGELEGGEVKAGAWMSKAFCCWGRRY